MVSLQRLMEEKGSTVSATLQNNFRIINQTKGRSLLVFLADI
jgi:hypothetical protein